MEKRGGGYATAVSVAHKAEPFLLKEDGKVRVFPTRSAAYRAGVEFLLSQWNSPIYAQITKPTESETLQQEVFGTIFRKGHATKVERKRRRAGRAS